MMQLVGGVGAAPVEMLHQSLNTMASVCGAAAAGGEATHTHLCATNALRHSHLAAHCTTRQQALEAAEAAELKKFEDTKRRALEQKAVQTAQLEELKGRILAERAEAKREGELLRTRALQVGFCGFQSLWVLGAAGGAGLWLG